MKLVGNVVIHFHLLVALGALASGLHMCQVSALLLSATPSPTCRFLRIHHAGLPGTALDFPPAAYKLRLPSLLTTDSQFCCCPERGMLSPNLFYFLQCCALLNARPHKCKPVALTLSCILCPSHGFDLYFSNDGWC